MQNFLQSESPYLVIALFIMSVFFFIATRPFMSPLFMRRGAPILIIFLSFGIGLHYINGENRAKEVREGFEKGSLILCSERRSKVGDRNIEVLKGELWRLEGDFFVNTDGNKFGIRQCLVSNEIINNEK